MFGIQKLGPYADYIVINVSSPNTPGLRLLQHKQELSRLILKCQEQRKLLVMKNNRLLPPLLVKISPDLSESELKDIAGLPLDFSDQFLDSKDVSMEFLIDGLIVSNTTVSRDSLRTSTINEEGGLSGRPLFELSTSVLSKMYQMTNGTIPLIGVGGVFTGQDAYDKIAAGASMVQVYSSLGFEGPFVLKDIKRQLEELLRQNNYKNVSEAIGTSIGKQK